MQSIHSKLVELKYTILRRAICYGDPKTKKNYSLKTLHWMCSKMELKDLEGLKRLHKEWIGY